MKFVKQFFTKRNLFLACYPLFLVLLSFVFSIYYMESLNPARPYRIHDLVSQFAGKWTSLLTFGKIDIFLGLALLVFAFYKWIKAPSKLSAFFFLLTFCYAGYLPLEYLSIIGFIFTGPASTDGMMNLGQLVVFFYFIFCPLLAVICIALLYFIYKKFQNKKQAKALS